MSAQSSTADLSTLPAPALRQMLLLLNKKDRLKLSQTNTFFYRIMHNQDDDLFCLPDYKFLLISNLSHIHAHNIVWAPRPRKMQFPDGQSLLDFFMKAKTLPIIGKVTIHTGGNDLEESIEAMSAVFSGFCLRCRIVNGDEGPLHKAYSALAKRAELENLSVFVRTREDHCSMGQRALAYLSNLHVANLAVTMVSIPAPNYNENGAIFRLHKRVEENSNISITIESPQ